ncbi:MAG TPA: hypothetical protein DCS55_01250 [Acidimicrobiaceae bacterium]|nr:hypothetical protein [Acidimicrobiaceae bacterium]
MQSFDALIGEMKPRLARAFVSAYGVERGQEALAEAMSWAAGHPHQLMGMKNPAGYLYRVGQSRSRQRRERPPEFPPAAAVGLPEIEPGLPAALAALSQRQRICVVLVAVEEWTYQEVADLLGVRRSSVQAHVERGMSKLREALGVSADVAGQRLG